MPGWDGLLPATEIRAVVGYLKTLSPRFASERPAVVPVAPLPVPPAGHPHDAPKADKPAAPAVHVPAEAPPK